MPRISAHILPFLSTVAMAVALPATSQAKPVVATASANPLAGLDLDIPATKMVLENGLTLVVHEDHSAPLVAVNIWYHVGSKNEPAGKTGFAHLFEHLMFNGSENFNDDFFKATKKLGATSQNGTTSSDRTNYFQTVPKNALDAMLWLESDRMGHLLAVIDQARLDEQRSVVKNEKRQGENRPYAKAWDLITRAMIPPGHPYDHNPIGSMEDLDAATLEDVREWFRSYYGPSNATLVLAGDITPEEAKAKVEKYFGDIHPGVPVSQPTSWVVKKTGSIRETAYDRVAQTRLYRVWNVAGYASPDTDYLQILGQVLAGDKNSRLYKRLVIDEQLATAVDAGVDNREIGGLFLITADLSPEGEIGEVERIIEEELQQIIATGPAPSEIARVRTTMLAGFARSLESISAKADQLAESTTYLGSPDGWKKSFERLKSADPADLRRAARNWLSDGDYVLKIKPFGDLKAVASSADRSSIPEPGEAIAAAFPPVERAILANGLKLVVVRRNSVPVVNFTMLINSGTPRDFASIAPGTGSLSMSLLDEGTSTRTAEEITEQVGSLGAQLGAGGGGETSSVLLSALKPALSDSLALYADVVMNPTFPQQEFDRLKNRTLVAVAQAKEEPGSIAARVLPMVAFGKESAYGQVMTEASTRSISRNDVVAFHDRWFRPNNASLIVTGDTSLAEIRPLIEAAFSRWKPAPVPETIVPRYQPPANPTVYLVDKPGAAQSVIRGTLLAPPRKDADEIALDTLNTVVGGGFTSRLNMKLREEKGWAYVAGSNISGGKGSRLFTASTSVKTDKTAESMNEISKLLKGLVSDNKINASELLGAKEELGLRLSSHWSTSSGITTYISDQIINDLPTDYYTHYPNYIGAATLDGVQAVARHIIGDRPVTWVIVGDRSRIEDKIKALNLGEFHVVDADGRPTS